MVVHLPEGIKPTFPTLTPVTNTGTLFTVVETHTDEINANSVAVAAL